MLPARQTVGRRLCPPGLIGGVLGAVGSLSLLPLASGVAKRLAHPPTLLGAASRALDIKQATYAEVAVLLLAVPLAAVVLGRVVPRVLERRVRVGGLSFEWASAGFAVSFLLCQRGMRPKHALFVGLALFVLSALGIAAFRRSFALRRWFARPYSRQVLLVGLAGSSLDLARRSNRFPPPNPINDLLIELLLVGCALIVLCVLAGFLAGRPRDYFARAGSFSWIAFATAGAGLFSNGLPSLVFAIPPAVMLLGPLLVRNTRGSRLVTHASLLMLALAFAWRLHWLESLKLDTFEEGTNLSFAQEYRRGARPYRDTYPLHGWGADGGVDAVMFAFVQPSVHAARVRQTTWAALAFLCFAAVCVRAYRSWGWGIFALLLTLSVRWLFHERHLLPVAALLCVILGLQRCKVWLTGIGGVLAVWSVFHSLDTGIMAVAAIALGLAALALIWRGRREWIRHLVFFAAGVLVGSAPFLILLAWHGSLKSFFRISFLELPRWVDAAWGLPAGSAWDALLSVRTVADAVPLLGLSGPVPWLFLVILLSACAAVVAYRAAAGALEESEAAFVLCLLFAAIAMRGALGRADLEHLGRYGFFAGMTGAWLVRRAWLDGRGGLVFVSGLFVLVGLHPLRALEYELLTVEGSARRDQAVARGTAPRVDGHGLPAEQAAELRQVATFLNDNLGPNETFFDFSNEPALYFLTGRRLPVRFHSVAQYQSATSQQEVISALEREKPVLAILPSGFLGALDGIGNRERAPLVASYLDQHYQPETTIAGRQIARRRQIPAGS